MHLLWSHIITSVRGAADRVSIFLWCRHESSLLHPAFSAWHQTSSALPIRGQRFSLDAPGVELKPTHRDVQDVSCPPALNSCSPCFPAATLTAWHEAAWTADVTKRLHDHLVRRDSMSERVSDRFPGKAPGRWSGSLSGRTND